MNVPSLPESLNSIYDDLAQASASLAALGELLVAGNERIPAGARPGLAHLLGNASKELDGIGNRIEGLLQQLAKEARP